MYSTRNRFPLRSVDDLADARDLRLVVSHALAQVPVDEAALRCAVWSFVGAERRAGVPAVLVIARLSGLIECASIIPVSAALALSRLVIRWCVEEYFGCLGGDVLATIDSTGPVSLPAWS